MHPFTVTSSHATGLSLISLELARFQEYKGIRIEIGAYVTRTTVHYEHEQNYRKEDSLTFGAQLADVSTRCSSHPQGIENAGA